MSGSALHGKIPVSTKRQGGFSLMEAVVAMSISLVVTAAMVALMANSLSNTARIVNMTKLSDDMRTTMQMLTRDVRRASYNANAMFCYGNDDCFTDGSVLLPGDITYSTAKDCFTFLLDRDNDGDSTENKAGGFRRVTEGAVGAIEMWVGGNDPDCTANEEDEWVRVTNPDSMDITTFNVDTSSTYTQEIYNDGIKSISQTVRKLRFQIDGRLVTDPSISRQMEDVISVRNDYLSSESV